MPLLLFEIFPTGDPYSPHVWDVREYTESFAAPTCVWRGDLSYSPGRDRTIRRLRRLYPGCKIRVSDH